MGKSNIKILLVNPSYRHHYHSSKIKEGAIYPPPLNLAVLAASLREKGGEVKIVDFNLRGVDYRFFKEVLLEFVPDYAGFSFSTPLFHEMEKLCQFTKETNKDIIAIGGGPHASSLPEETLRDSGLDMIVVGEGDNILPEITGRSGHFPSGVMYKKDGRIYGQPLPNRVSDLDALPFPAWELYRLDDYCFTSVLTRRNPAGFMETSRGCPFHCSYCNKSVFGKTFRAKSAGRVALEMGFMHKAGFNEIFIADDNFSFDLERAKEICAVLIKQKLNLCWTPVTGLRIDRVDRELLELMQRAGCYRIYYGVESGNQEILDKMGKGISLAQVKKAVRETKRAGLETFGFFMLGMPGETEDTMRDTITFSRQAGFDWAKVSITTPLPNTALFNDYEKMGFIKSRDWSKYNLYDIAKLKEIYDHPQLAWPVIEKFYSRFYRLFYLRPGFIIKRFFKSLLHGTLFQYLRHFVKTPWW